MSLQAPDVIEVVTGADVVVIAPIPGFFFKDSEVRVYRVETIDEVATEELLVLGVDYTITKALNSAVRPSHYTGTIETVDTVPVRQSIAVMVVPANEQLTDFSSIPHDPADYEAQHDNAAIRDQSALEFYKRAIRRPLDYIGPQPIISGGVAGRVPVWNSDGNLEDGPDAEDIENVEGYAAAAAASAVIAAEQAAIATAAAAEANPNNWTRQLFSGTGAPSDYILTSDPGSRDNVFLFIDGVAQQSSVFTVVGTILNISAPLGANNIEVKYGVSVDVGTPADETVTAAKISTSDADAIRIKIGAATAKAGRYEDLAYLPVGEDDLLHCDGSLQSRALQAPLFAKIGETYGAGDGVTTFNIPDQRGLVSRALDDGAGIDPDAASRTDRGDGTTGDEIGTKQADEYESHDHTASSANDGAHTHTYTKGTIAANRQAGASNATSSQAGASTDSQGTHSHAITVNANGGNETRMKNISVYRCITTGL